MAYCAFGAPNPEFLAKALIDEGLVFDLMPTRMPPTPFLPDTATCYALLQGQNDLPKRVDGWALRKTCEQRAAALRGSGQVQHVKRTVDAPLAVNTRTGKIEPVKRTSRSRSETQLSSSGAALPGVQRERSSGSAASSTSRLGTAKSVVAEDAMWKDLAPMQQRDHVSQLLNHPLPTRGLDNAHDFHLRSAVGPNPKPPRHIAIPQSLAGDTFAFGKEMKKACVKQRFSKDGGVHPNWNGLQRNMNSDHDDQMVRFKHLVRH